MKTASTTATQATADQLSDAVGAIGRLAQQGANEVHSLARLALIWLERPEGCRDLEVVAAALQSIGGTAQRMAEEVEDELHSVHCGYDDPAQMRRLAALSKAFQR
jgi:hypothetical protein